jgi:[ribosomal protein S5]-alanine N-acetyltransferase
MKPPQTFETERLLLRVPRMTDADAIFNYAQEPEVTRYLIWRPHKDISETEEFLRLCLAKWEAEGDFPWAITLKEDGQLIGMMGLRINGFIADVGYVLGRQWWGNGFATEALRSIVNWALSQPSIYRVWAMCNVDNLGSARVLEKVGMQREGVLRRNTLHPAISETPVDTYCYSIVK